MPHLQRGARAAAGVAASPATALGRWERRFAHGRPAEALFQRRQLLLLLAVLIVFAGSFVHLQRYPALDARQQVRAPGEQPVTGSELPGGAVTVGPASGAPLPAYVRSRRAALDAATGGRRVAVVSFTRYVAPGEALAMVRGARVLRAQFRIPAEGERPVETDVVGDLEASLDRAVKVERDRVAEEEASIRELLDSGTVTDPEYLSFYQRELERLSATRNLLDAGTPVLFALIVSAPVADLQRAADGREVRCVDLAPGESDPQVSTFYGLLPEDVAQASFGAPA